MSAALTRWLTRWLRAEAASVPVGLPLTADESKSVDAMIEAIHRGDPYRNPERDVRWLLSLLGRLDDRLTPTCECACHRADDHCDECCQGPLCEDCRAYAREG